MTAKHQAIWTHDWWGGFDTGSADNPTHMIPTDLLLELDNAEREYNRICKKIMDECAVDE